MEIIFELLFEFFGEYVLAFIWEALSSLFGSLFGARAPAANAVAASGKPADADGARRRGLGWPLRLAAGAVLGALSLYFFPHSFAKTLDLRLAVLIGVPLACGLSMGAIGALKRKRNQQAAAIDSFRNGFLFALPFVTVRFFFTT